MTTELSQHQALYCTASEAQTLLRRLQGAKFLMTYGVEVYTVPAEPMPMENGSKVDAVFVMCRAETDMQCGMGVGFVTAISEGLVK